MKIRTNTWPRRTFAQSNQTWSATGVPQWLAGLAFFLGLLIAGCDVHSPVGPASITDITVTPDVTLVIGETQQFTAVGKDADGNVVTFTPDWSIVAGGGTINGSGMFTAGTEVGVFTATVMASNGTHSGTATVTVTVGPLTTLDVVPDPATLAIGENQQFTVTGRDAGGNAVPVTASWTVVNGGGSIDAGSGLFTAGTVTGTFDNTVTATSGGVTGTATVTVTAGALAAIEVTPNPATLEGGEEQQFTAVGRDSEGNIVEITPTWDVVNGGGTIDATSGLFTTGEVAGTYDNTVEATSGGISGTATVIVTAGALATIEVTPNPATLGVEDTQQFTAVGKDSEGNLVSITPTWAVINDGGAIDSGSGLFTAGTVTGTFDNTVEATSGEISGTATVEVTAGELATIEVSPNPATVQTEDTQQFTAVGKDSGGNIISITPTWAVINDGGAIDSGSGLFTAGTVTGTFDNTVEATSGEISGTATVEVVSEPTPPASLLGSAADFGILAGSGIDCAISGTITGASTAADIGSSPTLTITGFPPCTFDGEIPSPADVATAKGDLTAAYLAAQGEVCDLDLTGIDLGFYDSANPLPPGTYCFSTSVGLTGTLELAGSATDTWTFQIGSTLTAAVGSQVILSGGAIADNVFWAVGSSATLNTNAAFQGNIMAQSSITLQADVSLLGRALAQDGAVALINGGVSIIKP